ncbi:hypothetical protein [Roseicyclus sp.]
MTLQTQKRWLRVSALVIGGFAPFLLLATIPATAGPAEWVIDLLGLPLDGTVSLASPEARFLCGLMAGFLAGWAATVWLLSGAPFDAAPEAVRRAVVGGALLWFVIDSAGSILSGHPSNAVFNIAVLALAVGPLWRSADA